MKEQNLQRSSESLTLTRKQIENRSQILPAIEYEKKIRNLQSQNSYLKKQIENLHLKVQEIKNSKKGEEKKDPVLERELQEKKRELKGQYEKMNSLKSQIKRNNLEDQKLSLKEKIRGESDQIHSINEEMKVLNRQKKKLTQILQQNTDALEEYHPKFDSNLNITDLKEENKQLRKKLYKLGLQMKVHERSSQQTIDKLYTLKEEEQKYMQLLIESKKQKQVKTKDEKNSVDVKVINQMKRQIEDLKKEKKQAEKQLVAEKIIKDQMKLKLEKEAQEGLDHHKELLRMRMKLLNQQNLFEAKNKQHRQYQEAELQKQAIAYEDRAVQTDKIIPKDFRREWIGKSEGFPFDDSSILQNRSQVSIKAVIIYKSQEHIAFVKFFYETPLKKRYQSKIPFENSVLRKYESRKHTARVGSFMKNFRLSLKNDKVTKIEIIWSDGDSSSEGWENEESTKYVGDIAANEKPVSMFGSVGYHGKNNYALESLGCEINIIENE